VKKIEAIIEPVQFQDVRESLSAVGVTDLATSEIRSVDPLGRHREMYRGVEYTVDLLPKIKIETVVADDLAECAVSAITRAASPRSGRSGNVFVSAVDEVVVIRNGIAGPTWVLVSAEGRAASA